MIGAHQLMIGTHQLMIGAHQLMIEAHQLMIGAHQLMIGAHQLMIGAHPLMIGAHKLMIGAHQLMIGAHQLMNERQKWSDRMELSSRLRTNQESLLWIFETRRLQTWSRPYLKRKSTRYQSSLGISNGRSLSSDEAAFWLNKIAKHLNQGFKH